MEGRGGRIGDVHRHLHYAVFVDIPTYCLSAFERAGLHQRLAVLVFERLAGELAALTHGAPLLANVEGDGVGAPRGGAVEVEVHGYEEVAGTYRRRARAGELVVPRAIAVVGAVAAAHALGQTLVFTAAAYGEVLALGPQCRCLVGIHGDAELVGHALPQLAGKLGTFGQRDARHGHERANVGGAHTRMRPVVTAHVNQFRRALYALEGGFGHRFRLAGKGYYCAVGGLAWINVQQRNTFDGLDGLRDTLDYLFIAALAEIGHAFYDSFLHGV